MYHGQNSTHKTDDCNQLKQLSKSKSRITPAAKTGGKFGNKSKNKTWVNPKKTPAKTSSDAAVTKKELALIRKMRKQESNATDRKRKSNSNSDEPGEVHSFTKPDEIDLGEFNYGDMNELSLEDPSMDVTMSEDTDSNKDLDISSLLEEAEA